MSKKIIPTVVLVLAIAGTSLAQSEHQALTNIRKGKWERAHRLLEKARRKDSVNTSVLYVYARFFSAIQNPDYQIDSASSYIHKAILSFRRSDPKQRERMKRFPLDSITLKHQRSRIDSAAFARAKGTNTEQAYLYFIEKFPDAAQLQLAITLRDEVAYHDALEINTYQSFLHFITKYPNAVQKDEARRKYEELLYETLTEDKRLETFENFLRDHPESPYRKNTEQNIFELATAAGSEAAYIQFIHKYPDNAFIRKARNILFHLLNENDQEQIQEFLPDDSVKAIQLLDQHYLIPFYTAGKYGFMNELGDEIVKPHYDSIRRDYVCGNITEDFIVFPDEIIARNDKPIFTGEIQNVNDLGYGFLEVETPDCRRIVHKTGFVVGDSCIQQGKILAGKFIAIRSHDRWSLWTLTGRKLFSENWDDLSTIKDVVLFKRNGKYTLATSLQLGTLAAEHKDLKIHDAFDEVKPWVHDQIWARVAEYQGLLNQNLVITLPFENHTLNPSFFGTIASLHAGKKIYLREGDVHGPFKNIAVNDPWVAVNSNDTWQLFDPSRNRYIGARFDSITFIGPFSIGHSFDTLQVYFNPQTHHAFTKKCALEFIPGKDSTSFLVVTDGDKKSVFNLKGHRLFTGKYDKIQYAGSAVFSVSKKEKKGLITRDGKTLLPYDYDAIGSAYNNSISLLNKLKFGLYDVVSNRQIKPQYDKNVVHYTDKLLVAFKDGLSGFIDWSNKPVGKFEFEEILYWNDTTAFVKKNFQWRLYDIYGSKVLIDNIKSYKVVTDTKEEKIFILNFENEYGVISNKKGTILPFAFNGIKNLGSADDPFYVTEKHVEEASVFIVIYYNKQGELIRKQVYEEEEYEHLYCADN